MKRERRPNPSQLRADEIAARTWLLGPPHKEVAPERQPTMLRINQAEYDRKYSKKASAAIDCIVEGGDPEQCLLPQADKVKVKGGKKQLVDAAVFRSEQKLREMLEKPHRPIPVPKAQREPAAKKAPTAKKPKAKAQVRYTKVKAPRKGAKSAIHAVKKVGTKIKVTRPKKVKKKPSKASAANKAAVKAGAAAGAAAASAQASGAAATEAAKQARKAAVAKGPKAKKQAAKRAVVASKEAVVSAHNAENAAHVAQKAAEQAAAPAAKPPKKTPKGKKPKDDDGGSLTAEEMAMLGPMLANAVAAAAAKNAAQAKG